QMLKARTDGDAHARWRERLGHVLALAARHGATATAVDLSVGQGLTVTVRRGEVEPVEQQRDKGISATVYIGQRKGSASTTDFSDRALEETVTSAITIARYASEDPCAGLPDPKYLATQFPDLDLCHPWHIEAEEAIELARECERTALEADRRITNSDGTYFNTYSGSVFHANSHGFIGGWDWSSHSVDCTVIAGSNGGMQRDGWYTRARDPADLEDLRDVGRRAAERAVARLGARQLSTRRVPVLFEAPVAGGLFNSFIGAISGGSLYRKASFLLDSL